MRAATSSAGQYAGLPRRVPAYLLDWCLLFGCVIVSQAAIRAVDGGLDARLRTGPRIEGWVLLTVSLPSWLYFILSERGSRGATLGKRALGLRVADEATGGRIGLRRSVLRTAVKLAPWELTHLSILLPTPLFSDESPGVRPGLVAANALAVAYLASVAVGRRRRAVHDRVAGTVVLDARR